MVAIPRDVQVLFWDVAPESVDLHRHRDYVMERVMLRGTWEAMCWLRRTYPRESIADFVERRGSRVLPPRELSYWALVSGVEVRSKPGGGRPLWAGPV